MRVSALHAKALTTFKKEVVKVPVAAQVKQTLADLKGVQSTLETFATHEENEESKRLLQRNAQRLHEVMVDFEKRLATLEFAEPQYKGF